MPHAKLVSLTRDEDSLEAFEAAFARCVGTGHVFVPDVEAPLPGTCVKVQLALASGETCLELFGTVAWAYPRGLAPPGREAGVGVRIDDVEAGARALLERMASREGAGALARPPGARLPPLELAAVPEESVPPVAAIVCDTSEADEPDDDLTTPDLKTIARESPPAFGDDELPFGRPQLRPLPPAPPFPTDDGALPELLGVAFLIGPGPALERPAHVERFAWPRRGSRRTSQLDEARESGAHDFAEALARDPTLRRDPAAIPLDGGSALADVDEAAIEEVTDPTSLVSAAVQRAVRSSEEAAELAAPDEPIAAEDLDDTDELDATDVDRVRPVFSPENTASEEVTSSDAAAEAGSDEAAPVGATAPREPLRLPAGLWLDAASGLEPLFQAGAPLPAEAHRAVTTSGAIELAVYEDAPEARQKVRRLLGIVRWATAAPSLEIELRVDEQGLLEVSAELDGRRERERFRTSWAPRRERPPAAPAAESAPSAMGRLRRWLGGR